MKVKKLRKLLRSADPNAIVVLSIDPEGNGYSPLDLGTGGMRYEDHEIGYEELTDDLKGKGYSTDDVMTGGKPCFVLWPA